MQDLESRLYTATIQIDELRSEQQVLNASLKHAVAENCRLKAMVRDLFQTHIVSPGISTGGDSGDCETQVQGDGTSTGSKLSSTFTFGVPGLTI